MKTYNKTMWKNDDLEDVGCSANDRRWRCLINLTKKLSEGEIELDQLVREVEKNKSDNAARHPIDHGILKKNKHVVVPAVEVETSERPGIGKKSGLKLTFKINSGKVPTVFCTQESVSKKITIKKPTVETQETSTAFESIKDIDRNPISTGKRRTCFNDKEGTSEKRAKKRTEIMKIVPNPVPILPEAVKNHIRNTGGCLESVVFVIQKGLYPTDVSTSHGRLSVPHGKVKNQFLRSTEVDQLDSSSGGIQVTLVQPCLQECEMSLKNWKSNSMYALVADWNEVCRNNALKEWTIIQLWSFRRNSALCFALVRIG